MVLVYSDEPKLTLELIAKGKGLAEELGKQVTAALIGKADEDQANEYIHYGADQVFIGELDQEDFKAEEFAGALAKIAEATGSETILIGSNKNGKELSARLASAMDTGCAMDCTDVYVKDGKLTIERIVYSGNAVAVEQFNTKPEILTIPPKANDPLEKDGGRSGEVKSEKLDVEASPSKILGVEEAKAAGVNVEAAEVIVSCGRGFKNKEDIKLAEDLAKALKGNTVGCSRPIAADLKWLPEDHWIGLSGHKVKPKLYIAAGISGQIQHIAGMRDSGIIVAINKDPEALIFNSSDYGIIGDLYKVLPKLTKAVEERMG